jgi:hypothetical protein
MRTGAEANKISEGGTEAVGKEDDQIAHGGPILRRMGPIYHIFECFVIPMAYIFAYWKWQ